MESQIATGADAALVLRLYELRTEEVLRKARHWVVFEFEPKTVEELIAVQSSTSTEQDGWLRQVVSYWEMAASFVLHGAVNADMFLDSNGEGIHIYAKFYPLIQELQARNGTRFMRLTGEMIEKFPLAKEKFQGFMASLTYWR
jgi:hypothetical protein